LSLPLPNSTLFPYTTLFRSKLGVVFSNLFIISSFSVSFNSFLTKLDNSLLINFLLSVISSEFCVSSVFVFCPQLLLPLELLLLGLLQFLTLFLHLLLPLGLLLLKLLHFLTPFLQLLLPLELLLLKLLHFLTPFLQLLLPLELLLLKLGYHYVLLQYL